MGRWRRFGRKRWKTSTIQPPIPSSGGNVFRWIFVFPCLQNYVLLLQAQGLHRRPNAGLGERQSRIQPIYFSPTRDVWYDCYLVDVHRIDPHESKCFPNASGCADSIHRAAFRSLPQTPSEAVSMDWYLLCHMRFGHCGIQRYRFWKIRQRELVK